MSAKSPTPTPRGENENPSLSKSTNLGKKGAAVVSENPRLDAAVEIAKSTTRLEAVGVHLTGSLPPSIATIPNLFEVSSSRTLFLSHFLNFFFLKIAAKTLFNFLKNYN